MIIGYARTSTLEQVAGFEAQIAELERIGCEKSFSEQLSSTNANRSALRQAIDFARHGDTLVVTTLSRLARSVADLQRIVTELEGKGVALRILDMAVDTSTPTGRLLLNLVGAISQFEREIMLSRQREGIAKAKAEKKYRGRAPTARRQADAVLKLRGAGIGATKIAAKVGVSRASVYRIISDAVSGVEPAIY